MIVHHKDKENYINVPEYFRQYCSWILIEHEGNTPHPTTTQVGTAQLDLGSNSHVFFYITMFTYIRPVKCYAQIFNGSKSPAKLLTLS